MDPVRPMEDLETGSDHVADDASAWAAPGPSPSGAVIDQLTGLYNHRSYHERLAEEVRRSNRRRASLGLLIFDIDHFRRINDVHGHRLGDEVLQRLAVVARDTCRVEDVLFRMGGEEFAVILPGSTLHDAVSLGERLRRAVARAAFQVPDPIQISVGVAEGPLHAASARELTSCAQEALAEAKDAGRNRVRVYAGRQGRGWPTDPHEPSAPAPNVNGNATGNGTGTGDGAASQRRRPESRPVAQLRMLHSLGTKLNGLKDMAGIGQAITAELRSLIDYHDCRVHLLEPDGVTLVPVAFDGDRHEPADAMGASLITRIDDGVTGLVARTGSSYSSPDAANDPLLTPVPGTPAIDHSVLAAPLRSGDRVIGTIVLSKLGVGQFDAEDRSMLEILASNAAVAFENARLFQDEREAAGTARALLGLSQALAGAGRIEDVVDEALRAIPTLITCVEAGIWVLDPSTNEFRLIGHRGFDGRLEARLRQHVVPAHVAEQFRLSIHQPFVLPKEMVAALPDELMILDDVRDALVAPIRWEPDGEGAIVIVAPDRQSRFSDLDLDLARGLADVTSLALGNARRFDELERAYVSTVEALANALEAQDAYTEAHCRALAQLAVTLGQELGLPGDRLKRLELGAVFHDIGKIGVPSEIIRKPGPLSAEERREMERHTVIGAQILQPVPFLQPVIPIVRSSHERWDGRGYPNRLSGEGIPLESRIVFVCDAFHAMTSNRPYRAALPEREAIRRLKLAAGSQFDPEVVAAFVRAFEGGRIKPHPSAGSKR